MLMHHKCLSAVLMEKINTRRKLKATALAMEMGMQNCLKPFVGFEECDFIKRWESHGPHPKKVCDSFSLKGRVSHEHLKGGNLELIFQLVITLGTTEEEKILLLYGTV